MIDFESERLNVKTFLPSELFLMILIFFLFATLVNPDANPIQCKISGFDLFIFLRPGEFTSPITFTSKLIMLTLTTGDSKKSIAIFEIIFSSSDFVNPSALTNPIAGKFKLPSLFTR